MDRIGGRVVATALRVFCPEEALWWDDIKGRDSVLPTLEILERQEVIQFAYFTIATEQEFRYYLKRFGKRQKLGAAGLEPETRLSTPAEELATLVPA